MKVPSFMFPSTCSVKRFLGDMPTGPSFETAKEIKCRIEETRSVVKGADGKELICGFKIFMEADEWNKGIRAGSEVTHADGYSSIVALIKRAGGLVPSYILCVTYQTANI